MAKQDPSQIARLVQALEDCRSMNKGDKKKTFNCKKTTFAVAGTNATVDSWKFMDWDYKRSDLPIYARGLFTTKRKDGAREIAVRGYDKFFNIDETNSTRWRNIEKNTRGPYELSVKENGCIIFISGLEDDKLLVCSKHSTGVREDVNLSHAQAGERWVERHVASVGRTVKDLARTLRESNMTAVGELCDDTFEEHVLAYNEEASGIYLHGLNYNLPEFATMSGEKVHQFADAWGFKKAKFEVFDDIARVQSFLEGCAETGTWDGRETEGFVIRCQLSEDGTGPYRDWFFKYKFEEPYLMYRQWRECTKAVIAGRLPKIKKHEAITEEYLQYARRRFVKEPQLAKAYVKNHGIISLREGFLQERGLKGSEIIAMEIQREKKGKENNRNVILVPIASLGCGKTTVALALVRLFGWGHVQNDNIPKGKGKPKKFAFEVSNSLSEHAAVIADRNNHQKRERMQLMQDIYPVLPDAQFIALHYVHEPKNELLPRIKEVTRSRILERGDNHQTIRAATVSRGEIIGIMDGFLSRFEAVDPYTQPDESFDQIIDLDVCASSRENLETVVTALHAKYPGVVPNMPTGAEMDAAIDAALRDYHVEEDLSYSYKQGKDKTKKNNNNQPEATVPTDPATKAQLIKKQLAKETEYFSVNVPSREITSVLESLFPPSTPPHTARLYNQLLNSRRIQPAFHVTLIHRSAKKEHPQTWDAYVDRAQLAQQATETETETDSQQGQTAPSAPSARVRLERLIWDDRIMAFIVRLIPASDAEDAQWPCVNVVPHITVGTAGPNIKPKESNDLLQRWLEVGSGGETGIFEAEVQGVRVVEGIFGAVMSRR
ncbi:hypothetical protein N7474_008043 [Penicillium riverlandense]|uniref:uncharacterized protein n=1 Tax=Penicillium riverlandense TaxID=1903569 RepID=UPI0025466861|nr:uncharacterized protein N7474_008043 [Penicillium riverlandense]KAJ5811742.1 hypothetical protein N7474_008043 [Penicillium riverlandense]